MYESDHVRSIPRRGHTADRPNPPTVPGLTLCRPLSPGRDGPPWRAKDQRSGYDVVLRPLPAGCDAARVAAELAQIPDHPHLLVPRLLADSSGRPMLATRFATHRGLDALVARRGALTPSEGTSLALGIGRAVSALHASGLTHGAISARAIVLGTEARPFLELTPMVTRSAAAGGSTTAADDVAALAEVLRASVEAPVPPRMAEVLLAATEGDSAFPAADLVRRLVAACPPEAIRLTGPAPAAAPGPVRRRSSQFPRIRLRAGPPVLLGAAAVAALAVAVVAGMAWARIADDQPAPLRAVPVGSRAVVAPVRTAEPTETRTSTVSSTPVSPAPATDWAQVLADLDSRREEAFTQGDVDALTDVDAPGSAELAADLAALKALTAAGVHASGFRQVLGSVHPLRVTPARVVLLVVDERPAYALVRASDGSTVETRPARMSRRWRVELVMGAAGWQVGSVRPT